MPDLGLSIQFAADDTINRELASTSEPWENEDDKVKEG